MRILTPVILLALLTAGCLPARPPLRLEDTVIREAVTWQGEVRIRGVVTVKKEGSLTILPGTRILFERIDRDGDGIGDGELLVEGELLARGTATAPIVFSSAAPQPRPADWKFLYCDFARRVEVEYLLSEYAYSGIQVHFCKGRVLNSEFRYNVDGVRFSTVNLEVAGNRIHHNTHGLRYEERRGTAQVHHNEIRDNEIGIFIVTRAEDKTRLEENNIAENRQYNVKLGLEQDGDVTFPRNWWGSPEPAAISATIFDRGADASLGQVQTPEPLAGPVDIDRWRQQQGG